MPDKELYFLAIIPPKDISDQLWDFKNQIAKRFLSKASLRSPPHVTLHMPFRWPHKKRQILKKRLTLFCEHYEPCSLRLNGFGAFPPKVIYVQVENNPQLTILQKDLCQMMAQKMSIHNANYRNQPFKPHLTIAFRDLKKNQFHKAWAYYQTQKYQVFSNINQLTLLKHSGHQWESECNFQLGR